MSAAPTPFSADLLPTLLAVSMASLHLVRPRYGVDGSTIEDFALEYVSPAGQRMAGLPEQPGGTLRTRYPHALAAGVFDYYCRAFTSGELLTYAVNYQADGLDNYFRFQAQRHGEQLVVSFSDTAGQDRSPVEVALRASQAHEQAAGAALGQLNHELEARVQARTHELAAAQAATAQQRWQLEQLLLRAPIAICIFDGPEWVYEFVNPGYQAMFPGRALLGKRLVDALPEVADQPLMQILHRVYDTGEPFTAREVLVPLARTADGPVEDIYFDLTYQARLNEAGQIDGFLTYATDVTAQVQARHQADLLQAGLLAAAQRQVQQREELFQIFEQAPAAIVLLREPNHRIEYVNPAYQQLFPHVGLRGQLLGEAHPRAEATGVLARLDRVYQTGQPYVGQEQPVELTPAPGQPAQTHYFNFTYQPYREPAGIAGVSIFAYDVTTAVLARRAVTEALEQQRGELQRVFEQAPVAIFVLQGPHYVLAVVNPAMSEMLGQPVEALQGRPYFEAVPELVSQGYPELLAQVWRTGQAVAVQESPARLAYRRSGETGYFNFVYQPLFEQDQLTAVMCVAVDVTAQVVARQRVEQLNQELEARVAARTRELREAQAATERERALLQALLTQAPVAIGLFQGEELRVTAANELIAAIWGYPPAQVLGLPFMESVPELQGQGFDDLLRQVLHTQVPVTGTETPATMLRDGEPKTTYYNFVYQPLYNAEGEVLGVINVAVEVTEQVEARRRMEQLNQELEARVQARTQEVEAARQELAAINEELLATNEELSASNSRLTRTNHDLDTFVYTASHDLKAPITNIESILNALRDTLPAEVQQNEVVTHILGLLDHTVGRFRTTIDQLTDLTRLQQTYEAAAERLLLASVVEGVLADLTPQITAAAAQVQVGVPADLGVSFAPASLRSVVYNLLSNAVKYRSPERPAQVWLQAEQRPNQVVLSVRDNGLGLTLVQQQRLFGIFQRLHTHVEGTGVGLYMIKRLIDNAGATITVTSSPGNGSTFTVAFPS